jgi:hypothetical protein
MGNSSQEPESVKTIEEFLKQPNLEAKRSYVSAHPYLLSDHALRLFDHLREAFIQEGDSDFGETLRQHRALVERSREVGVTQAFNDFRSLILGEKFKEFVSCRSWMDSYVYLEKHPDLTYTGARDIMIYFEEQARRSGDKEQAKIINVHAHLLYLVEKVGADAAFTEIGGDDFLTSRHPDDD